MKSEYFVSFFKITHYILWFFPLTFYLWRGKIIVLAIERIRCAINLIIYTICYKPCNTIDIEENQHEDHQAQRQ